MGLFVAFRNDALGILRFVPGLFHMTIELYTLLMATEWQSLNSPSFVFAIAYNSTCV